VDVMHGWGSLLRQSIRRVIVYCYPSDDFNTIKIFNGIVILECGLPGKDAIPDSVVQQQLSVNVGADHGCGRAGDFPARQGKDIGLNR